MKKILTVYLSAITLAVACESNSSTVNPDQIGNGGAGGAEETSGSVGGEFNCTSNEDCINDNPCQTGLCENNICAFPNVPNGTQVHVCDGPEDYIEGFCISGEMNPWGYDGCWDVCSLTQDTNCSFICGSGKIAGYDDDGVAFEECDDGNLINGDGCNSNCEIENNYICASVVGETSVCYICGDRICNDTYESNQSCPEDCN